MYGADGLRRQATVAEGGTTKTTDYALDGQNVVREMQAGVPTATYLPGPSGPLYRRSDVDGSIRWYVYDGLGSVVGEVDPSGNLTSSKSYDVYGATRSSAGTATTKHGFVGGLGHPTEDETGLIYMRARYYDPVVGRFVSQDPGRNGSNWFVYARCNPVNMVDKDGKVADWVWQAGGAALALLLTSVAFALTTSMFSAAVSLQGALMAGLAAEGFFAPVGILLSAGTMVVAGLGVASQAIALVACCTMILGADMLAALGGDGVDLFMECARAEGPSLSSKLPHM